MPPPFLIPMIAIALGIVCGQWLQSPIWGGVSVIISVTLYLGILSHSHTPLQSIRNNGLHRVWIFFLFVGIGLLNNSIHLPLVINEEQLNNIVRACGEIEESVSYADGDLLTVKLNELTTNSGHRQKCRNLKVLVKTSGFSTEVGDIVEFIPSFQRIEDNPNFRPSGYAERMKHKGILYYTRLDAGYIILKGHINSIWSVSLGQKNRISAIIEKSSLSTPTKNFIIAMLLGDRSMIRPDVREMFSNAGVAHILALSGMHIGIILEIMLFILFPLNFFVDNRIRLWTGIVFIWIYAYFSGLAPSTIRACLMATFLVGGLTIGRKNNSWNALTASAFVILLFTPTALYDIGFQLSFLCVACILTFSTRLNPVSLRQHPYLYKGIGTLLVTLVATTGTWSLVSYYFKKIPLMFLPVNLIMLPVLPAYIGISIIYVVLLCIGKDLHPLSILLDKGYEIMQWSMERISSYGVSTIHYQIAGPVALLWISGIAMIVWGIYTISQQNKRLCYTSGIIFLSGSLLLIPFTSKGDAMIVQRNYASFAFTLYQGEHEMVEEIPRTRIGKLTFKDVNIITLDTIWDDEGIIKERFLALLPKSSNLLIGSGASKMSLSDIPEIKNFKKIIIHSSVRRKKEREWMSEADSLRLTNIHSLRENGPLILEL